MFAVSTAQISVAVMDGQRPRSDDVQVPEPFQTFAKACIDDCWHQHPPQRPTFGGQPTPIMTLASFHIRVFSCHCQLFFIHRRLISGSVAQWSGRWTCDWRSRVQSQPLHCRVQLWTSCSHKLSSASEVTTLWCYINQLKNNCKGGSMNVRRGEGEGLPFPSYPLLSFSPHLPLLVPLAVGSLKPVRGFGGAL